MSNFPEKIKIGVTHSLLSLWYVHCTCFSCRNVWKARYIVFHGKIMYRNKSEIYRKPLLIHSDFVEVSFFYYVDEANHH